MDSKKIIIVDDDIAILDSLSLVLDMEGFDVQTFERGTKFFESVENNDYPDLIILDMWLKNEDGRDICKKIKQCDNMKNIPVIIMSASRGLQDSALEAGANAFIPKSFDFDAIINTLKEVVA